MLAKNTGAAQFEEKYEIVPISQVASRRIHKRSSDEDVDYEVYQGVVGRPGIDFPIFPKIPQTSFSCRNFGSGYFADLETDCQVTGSFFLKPSFPNSCKYFRFSTFVKKDGKSLSSALMERFSNKANLLVIGGLK